MQVVTTVTGSRRRGTVEVDLVGTMSLRELVDRLVHAEVAGHEQRRRGRTLAHVLTPDEVADGVARGTVDSGGRRSAPAPAADVAVATALQAFEDGLWLVFVDDRRVEHLEAPVVVTSSTTVRFVRLVALAGG